MTRSEPLDVDPGPTEDVIGGPGEVPEVGGYEGLRRVLDLAYEQASVGKGNIRHADGRDFDDQPIMLIQELVGTGFSTGQAIKKLQESQRLDGDRAKQELLGAIIYIAGAYLFRERKESR